MFTLHRPRPAATLPGGHAASCPGSHAPAPAWQHHRAQLPGLLLCLALAAAALLLAGWTGPRSHLTSPLTLAMLLGAACGNLLQARPGGGSGARLEPGLALCRQTLLRGGIVLYGLRLTLGDLAHIGSAAVAVDALVLASTILLARVAGTRWLGLDARTATLIGAGSAICGAAAVMATQSAVRARAEDVAVALVSVVACGTGAVLLYPLLYEWNQHARVLPPDARTFGIYIGSTVHEVAQVVSAARAIGPQAADTAVVTKMARVLMLLPFLLVVSRFTHAAQAGAEGGSDRTSPAPGAVPWFAAGFLLLVLLRTWLPVPAALLALAATLDQCLLAVAMAALGLGARWDTLRAAGIRPLLLGLGLFAWLVVGGACINRWVPAWLG